MPLFRALAKNMAPMTNADESLTNRLTLFPIYLSLFIVSTLCPNIGILPGVIVPVFIEFTGVPRQQNFKYILLKVHHHGRQLLCCFNPQGLSENTL